MKTLTRTIIVISALSMLTAVAQAQTSQPEAPVVPSGLSTAPTEPTPSVTAPTSPPLEPSSIDIVANDVYNLTNALSLRSRTGNTGTVLVIPSGQTPTEDLLDINEDMNVMSRIFEKNLEQSRIITAHSSIFVSRRDAFGTLLGGGRSGIQSMYLQGFGALFLMNVDFPLSPTSDMREQEKETEKTEQGDPVWREMRQQMFEPQKAGRKGRNDRPESKYNPEKVENLKTTLIKALKHAANIRCLQPDESMILTVVGKGDVAGTTVTAARKLPGEDQIFIQERTADGRRILKMVSGSTLDSIALSWPAVLVIRTKKSDIDEFAKGDVDFANFRQRVRLLTYPLLGGTDDGHGNPLDFYYKYNTYGSSNRR